MAKRSPEGTGSDSDADALAAVDLSKFYGATEAAQIEGVQPFLRYRNEEIDGDIGKALFSALRAFSPFNRLVNETMVSAIPLAELGHRIFPGVGGSKKLEQLSRRTILPDFLSDFSSLSGVTGINHR